VAVGLRLGVDLCISHTCPCGLLVDTKGSHSLSCKLACGRMTRHFQLNDVIFRALASAEIPASKEPSGLLRSDGKRPDGVTLIPWQSGRSLTWDVTVAHTTADSYLDNVASTAGGVAEMAADRKLEKYSELAKSYFFNPFLSKPLDQSIRLVTRLFVSSADALLQFLVIHGPLPFYINVYLSLFNVLMLLLFADVFILQTWTRNHCRCF